jgi:hypothetical protein
MPDYRLLSENGDDFGLLRSKAPEWNVGEDIYRVTGEVFRLVRIMPAMDGDEIDSYLVVKLLTGGKTSH